MEFETQFLNVVVDSRTFCMRLLVVSSGLRSQISSGRCCVEAPFEGGPPSYRGYIGIV